MNDVLHPSVMQAAERLELMRKKEADYLNRHKHQPTAQDIEKLQDYMNKVHAPSKPKKIKSVYSKYYKTLDYQMVRRKLSRIATKNARRSRKRFQINSDLEKWIWQQSLKWLTYQDDCDWSLDKDLMLFGLTGVGKSFLCKCLVELAEELQTIAHPMDKWLFDWGFTELNDLYEECVRLKSFAPIQSKTTNNWVFDELGNEKLSIKIYSNETRFFERIITKREAGHHPKRAIYISNYDLNGLLTYYNSTRFESRFKRLIEDEVRFEGHDKRTNKIYDL